MRDDEGNALRSFGVMVGGLLAAIGAGPLVFGHDSRGWALLLGGLLVLFGIAWPSSLRPVYRMWMAIGHVLGRINTAILLSVVFFGLITPMGIVMRMLGKDPMRRSAAPQADSYRVVRGARPGSHMTRQF
jgi:hypothetical protein